MKVYTYNPITGDFITDAMADEDQLNPGNYLMPAYSTTLEPPAFDPETEIIYFDPINSEWKKQNIESEPHVNIFSEEDIEKIKAELKIVQDKKEAVLAKLGLSQKEIDLMLVNLPTEDVINKLLGQPIPEQGIPSLLPPE